MIFFIISLSMIFCYLISSYYTGRMFICFESLRNVTFLLSIPVQNYICMILLLTCVLMGAVTQKTNNYHCVCLLSIN